MALSDIFNYTSGSVPTQGGGENGQNFGTPSNVYTGHPMEGFSWNGATNDSQNGSWSYNTPSEFKNVLNLKTDDSGNAHWDNNYRNLPNHGMTKYGPVEYDVPYNPNSKLANPNLHYKDPLYGDITTSRNILPDKDVVGSLIPRLAMVAASAGFGALALPELYASLGVSSGIGKAGWGLANTVLRGGIMQGNSSNPTRPTNNQAKYTGPMPSASGKTKYTGQMPSTPWKGR